MNIYNKFIFPLLILVIGLLIFSCKSGSIIKRKYVNGNYISFAGKPKEPKLNQTNSANVKPTSAPFIANAKNESDNVIVNAIIFDEQCFELNTIAYESIESANKKIFRKKQKEVSRKKIRFYEPKPFPFPIFDFSYLFDDDPIAKKMRILFFISLGIIVLGLPILYLLGMYSSIDGFFLLAIFGIGILVVLILSIINFFLNIKRWRKYKN